MALPESPKAFVQVLGRGFDVKALGIFAMAAAASLVVWYIVETGKGDIPVYKCSHEDCELVGTFPKNGGMYCFIHFWLGTPANDA